MHDVYPSPSLKPRETQNLDNAQSVVKVHNAAHENPARGEHEGEDDPDFSREKVSRPRSAWLLLGFIGALCLLGLMFFVGWSPLEHRETALTSEANLVKTAQPRVVVISPQRSAPAKEILIPGEVQAVRETTIYARTNGYLKRWLVDIGDIVTAGQLLAEIDSPEVDMQLEHAQAVLEQTQAILEQNQASYEQAKANLEQSKAALEQARATLEQSKAQVANAQASADSADLTMKRYDPLRGTSAVTEQDIQDKETAVKTAHAMLLANQADVGAKQAAVGASQATVGANQAAVVAAQAAIGAARANIGVAKADVRQLEVLKSFEKVNAPFDGTITSRQTEAGSLVAAGSGTGAQPLFHLACMNPMRIFLDVPQNYAPAIKVGQSMQLMVREYPNGKYLGTVARTSGAIETATRTLRTEIHVPNPTGELLSGMYAQVKLSIVHSTPPLLLPSSALIVNADGTQVALVQDGHVHFQPIALEADYGANFGVSTGLSETDAVIANPSERLTEGLAVSVAVPAKQ